MQELMLANSILARPGEKSSILGGKIGFRNISSPLD